MQLDIIKSAAQPFTKTERLRASGGKLEKKIPIRDCGVVYFELTPSELISDRGYDYSRVIEIR